MATSATTLNPKTKKRQKTAKKVTTGLWLLMALIVGMCALLVWIFSEAPVLKKEDKTSEQSSVSASSVSNLRTVDKVDELAGQVKPISFDALLRDLRDYPPEFKDVRYLKANQGKWTVQVMDVSENDIVTDYLNEREDREKFAYFRYRDENNQSRYVLTYDVMASPQMAMGATKTIDFGLPANVRVIPEELNRYASLIENYELSEPVKDLGANRVRSIKLQPTSRELAVKASRPTNATASSTANNSTSPQASKPASSRPNRNTSSQTASNNTASSTNQASSASSSNNASGNSSASSIRESANTEQTIAVNETRSVASEAPDNAQSSNQTSQANQNRPQSSSPKPNTQINKQTKNQANSQTNNAGSAQQAASQNAPAQGNANGNAGNDPIREIIEDSQ